MSVAFAPRDLPKIATMQRIFGQVPFTAENYAMIAMMYVATGQMLSDVLQHYSANDDTQLHNFEVLFGLIEHYVLYEEFLLYFEPDSYGLISMIYISSGANTLDVFKDYEKRDCVVMDSNEWQEFCAVYDQIKEKHTRGEFSDLWTQEIGKVEHHRQNVQRLIRGRIHS